MPPRRGSCDGRVIAPDDIANYHAIRPLTNGELASVRIHHPAEVTLDELRALETLATVRACGRVAVVHDDAGTPSHLYFFGHSGD
ncbi:hypothetical protein AB0I28_30210 [Phytomonospora sp. NPDC050363]|uniref:hypothetical protein n=1 Tax=Phytomonospora sp. NPDC050363 TaxID=3155642 RepID=UPI0033CE2454